MTKAIPGAKRGRPVRKQGRIAAPLREHADRYSLAIFDAVTETFGESERASAGVMVAAERLSRRAIISTSLRYPLPDAIEADFNRIANRLRAMSDWYSRDAADLRWRRTMSRAIRFAIAAAAAGKEWRDARPHTGDVIVNLAAKAGEAEWARRVLLPIMERDPATDEAENLEMLADFLKGVPNFSRNRDERLLQFLLDFWILRAS